MCDEGSSYTGLAYLWLETPCSGEELCPLYSDDQFNMPVAPCRSQNYMWHEHVPTKHSVCESLQQTMQNSWFVDCFVQAQFVISLSEL